MRDDDDAIWKDQWGRELGEVLELHYDGVHHRTCEFQTPPVPAFARPTTWNSFSGFRLTSYYRSDADPFDAHLPAL